MAMQTVSLQLLKPPKDLASWSFPLSQILEDYFNLLPEPCKIHYGEAALVIQNSVNAYVRRVEELYDETRFFSKKMTVNSKENGAYLDKEKKQKKSLLGIGQFEVIDFDQDKGKTINLKSQDKKTFKFLHGCFSQLENYNSKVAIEVFDVKGEVIGKKYSFRCNHHMTQDGILVDEFNEKDFSSSKHIEECRIESPTSTITENRNELDFDFQNVTNFQENANSTMEESMEGELTTGIQDDTSDNESESNFSDAPNSNSVPLEQEVTNETDALDSSRADSAEFFESEKISEEPDSSNVQATNNDSCNTLSEDSGDINSVVNLEHVEIEHNLDSGIEVNIRDKAESENTLSNSETVQDKEASTSGGNSSKRSRSNTEENDEDVGRPLRSKRLKEMNDKESSCNDNDKLLQPIPFEDGIPKKTLKSRKEFRLPCHINLLKPRNYKRKSTKNNKKVAKITSNESDVRTRSEEIKKKTRTETSGLISTPSSSNPLSGMKQEDQEEFHKLFEETISQHLQSSVQYEPVTTLTMDLLGFHPTYNKTDSPDSLSEGSSRLPFTSDIRSSLCLSPASSTYSADNAVSPPPDPTAPSNQNQNQSNQRKSADNIGKAIKDKIKEIYEELDILTDEDQKIAKWHEEIKPRLEEAERKPPFRIQDYESRIIKKLETSDRKLDFEEIIREEPPSEVARYFSATLQLASTNNLNINPANDLKRSIELILVE